MVTKKYNITPTQILMLGIFFFAILTAAVSILHPNFRYDAILQVVVANNHDFNSISNSESIIHYYQLQPTVLSVLINAPWALLSGLFRPVIGETGSLMGIAASCENLVIMILFISSIYGVAKNKQSPSILVLSVIVFIVILCIFLALSTPNLGTLSRYRVGFLPFFIFLITYQNPLVTWMAKHSPFSRK